MLRLFVLVLIFLNSVYFAWGQGWLLPYGWGPAMQREPQRLAQQVRPEALTLRQAGEPAQATTVVSSAPASVCLQSAELDGAQAAELRNALQAALPIDTWAMEALGASPRWLIYMGKYANAVDVAKKRAQLVGLGLKLYPLGNPALAPGLSLGNFATQEQADAALQAFKQRGVRTARVLEDAPASAAYRLQLRGRSEDLQKPLADIAAILPGKPLVPCAPSVPVPQ